MQSDQNNQEFAFFIACSVAIKTLEFYFTEEENAIALLSHRQMLAIDLIITVLARLSYVNENILNIDKIRIRQKTLKETKLGLVNYLFLLDLQVPDTNNG